MQRSCVRVAMSRAENAKRAGKLQSFGVTTMPRVRFYPGSAMLSKWRTAKIVTLVPKNGCCWERKLMLPSERALPSLFQGPFQHWLYRRSSHDRLWPCYSGEESWSRFQHATSSPAQQSYYSISPRVRHRWSPDGSSTARTGLLGCKVESGLQPTGGGSGHPCINSSSTIPQTKEYRSVLKDTDRDPPQPDSRRGTGKWIPYIK